MCWLILFQIQIQIQIQIQKRLGATLGYFKTAYQIAFLATMEKIHWLFFDTNGNYHRDFAKPAVR
jgi:hypothetical protein